MASLRTLRSLRRGGVSGAGGVGLRLNTSAPSSSSSSSSLSLPLSTRRTPASSRAFSDLSPIQALTDVILHSPVNYGLTIAGITVLVRSAISLPAALWTRARIRRLREVVMPLMKAENDRLAFEVFRECKMKGVGPEVYMKELKKRVADAQFALHRKHSTHPVFTMAVPFLVNIPVLIATSLAIRNAVTSGDTALVGQSLLWIKDITEPDGLIGVVAGCLAFGSSELHSAGRRKLKKVTEEEADPSVPVDALAPVPPASPAPPVPSVAAAQNAKLSSHLRPRTFSTSAVSPAVARPMRKPRGATATVAATASSGAKTVQLPPGAKLPPGVIQTLPDGRRRLIPFSKVLENVEQTPGAAQGVKDATTAFQTIMEYGVKYWSIGLIGMSLFQPAALVAYWTCSITYTLVQNLVFARMDQKYNEELRQKKLRLVAAQGQVLQTNAAAAAGAPPPSAM